MITAIDELFMIDNIYNCLVCYDDELINAKDMFDDFEKFNNWVRNSHGEKMR